MMQIEIGMGIKNMEKKVLHHISKPPSGVEARRAGFEP
jgi:hypothetical protein